VDGAAVAAAVAARAQLPPALAGQVVRTGATGADGVWFVLRGGARVQWGSADRAGEKADVLAALLAAVPGARRYDVSAPDAPAVTPR
jgi:cell division protein FtsQ